jgi:hypothetical protein
MPDRYSAACVHGETQVIFFDAGEERSREISLGVDTGIDVVAEVNIVFAPVFNATLRPLKPPGDIAPIKSFKGTYVYPAIKFNYVAVPKLQVLKVDVKVPLRGVAFDSQPCIVGDGNYHCYKLITTLLHPFVNEYGRVIPAYTLEVGDKIFVDRSLMAGELIFQNRGMVTNIDLLSPLPPPPPVPDRPDNVYGLIVTDQIGAQAFFDASGVLNNNLGELVGKLNDTIGGPIEKADSVVDYLKYFLYAQYPSQQPGKLNGLEPIEHVIITNKIPTGTVDIQEGLYRKHRDGYFPDDLIL